MAIYEVKHPLVRHKLGLMRQKNISTKEFRELASELARLLTYEATRDLETEIVTIRGWAGPVEVEKIKGKKITVVPILRAGLGMLDGVLDMIPSVKVSVVGLYRDEETLEPVDYFKKLARDLANRTAIILDPMLATGGSAVEAIRILKRAGVPRVKFVGLIAAPDGVKAVQDQHPDVPLYLAAVDDHLNDVGYIVPGLGDAGDRQFGTPA